MNGPAVEQGGRVSIARFLTAARKTSQSLAGVPGFKNGLFRL